MFQNQGSFNFCIVFSRTTTFSTLNHTPSEVRQSPNFTVVFYAVTIKCTYVFCEAKALNGQKRVKAVPNPISVPINDEILNEGYKNNSEN